MAMTRNIQMLTPIIYLQISLVITFSSFDMGLWSIIILVCGLSVARAIAPKVSIIMLIHKSIAGLRGEDP
jgi:hypothetical protein